MTEGMPREIRSSMLRRQFLIQGCWNYEGMQNVGFAYVLLPALRHYYRERPEDLIKALKRNLEYYNSHPAMGGMILGATARIEERIAAGESDPRAVGTFKVGLMGTLGAIGDSYFWGALKPVASVTGAILSLLHPALGIAALLLLYNAFHIPVRLKGFAAGLEGEESAFRFLKGAGFAPKTEDWKILAAVLGGAYAGAIGGKAAFLFAGGASAAAYLLVCVAAVHLVTVLLRKAVSPSEILLFLLVVGAMLLWG